MFTTTPLTRYLPRRVRVGDGVHAQVLGALVLAGPLRVADEEALLRA